MAKVPLSYPRTFSPSVRDLLDRLHDASSTQESNIDSDKKKHIQQIFKTDFEEGQRLFDDEMRDKFIALDKDKALLVYNLVLSSGATSIVEIGTSFGVSTIYLALAALENARTSQGGVKAKVIGTEKEESKAQIARKHWSETGNGIEDVIDLRVGDLLETLRDDLGEVHFVLLDSASPATQFHQILLTEAVWPYVALPALELLLPKLRDGAIVVTDNTISSGERYSDLLNLLRNGNGPFESVTLPYTGGLEFSVYKPRRE